MKIDIKEQEIKALDKVLSKIKTDIQTGFILGNFRMRLQTAINIERKKEAEKQAKEILGVKDERKERN